MMTWQWIGGKGIDIMALVENEGYICIEITTQNHLLFCVTDPICLAHT